MGRGIYDLGEIARMINRSVPEVTTWARPTLKQDALLQPRKGRLFCFYDLITAEVVAQLRRRSVTLGKIRDARHFLAGEVSSLWPLAHAAGLRRLASVGSSVYYEGDDGWLDASQGGQVPFLQVVTPLIKRLEFDDHGMAALWRPAEGVLVDPTIQAGAPCVEGTRISTFLLADLVDAGEDPEDIAADFELDPDRVRQALRYEHQLAA